MLFAPFGYALRAGRDSPLRAEAIGIDVQRVHWLGFASPARRRRWPAALFAFSKGIDLARDASRVGTSVDGLVMVLLGGVQTLTGPLVGAAVFTWLQDTVMRQTDYWRALLGAIILLLVLVFPRRHRRRARQVVRRSRERSVAMSVLVGPRPAQVVRRRARRRRRQLRPRRRRVAGADRPERRRQVDLLQHGQRPARARPGDVMLDGHELVGLQAARRSGAWASAAPSRSPRPSAR